MRTAWPDFLAREPRPSPPVLLLSTPLPAGLWPIFRTAHWKASQPTCRLCSRPASPPSDIATPMVYTLGLIPPDWAGFSICSCSQRVDEARSRVRQGTASGARSSHRWSGAMMPDRQGTFLVQAALKAARTSVQITNGVFCEFTDSYGEPSAASVRPAGVFVKRKGDHQSLSVCLWRLAHVAVTWLLSRLASRCMGSRKR